MLQRMKEQIDKILGLQRANRRVDEIKEDATNRVNSATVVLKKQGKLQTQVMHKTTTYYLGKAYGIIN